MNIKIISLLLFGLVNAEFKSEQKGEEDPNKHLDDFGYDPRVMGMGSTTDIFDNYGAIPNEFNLDQDKFLANRQVSLLYTFHSEDLQSGNSISGRVHHEIVLPAIKDLKGYLNFYLFDCQHPLAS